MIRKKLRVFVIRFRLIWKIILTIDSMILGGVLGRFCWCCFYCRVLFGKWLSRCSLLNCLEWLELIIYCRRCFLVVSILCIEVGISSKSLFIYWNRLLYLSFRYFRLLIIMLVDKGKWLYFFEVINGLLVWLLFFIVDIL